MTETNADDWRPIERDDLIVALTDLLADERMLSLAARIAALLPPEGAE